MKKMMTITLVGLMLVVASVTMNAQEMVILMKVDGVQGECQDKDHKGWIDLTSVAYEAMNQGPVGGESRTRSQPDLSDISVIKTLDKSSAAIIGAVMIGKIFPKIEIEFCFRANGQSYTYLHMEFTNVRIKSLSTEAQMDEIPLERIAFDYEEIRMTHTEYDAQGQPGSGSIFSWKKEASE